MLLPESAGAATFWTADLGTWFDDSNWTVGGPGNDDVATIDNGGTSQILLPGAVARNVFVGHTASGNLEIASGGTLSNWQSRIGNFVGSTGSATVTGGGSEWAMDGLWIGARGAGSLSVAQGGRAESEGVIIGEFSPGEGTLTVQDPSSAVNVSGSLTVGLEGDGQLNVFAGAAVENRSASLGLVMGSTGTVFVSGTGSHWTTSGDLGVGVEGTGELTIAHDASVEVEGATYVGGRTGTEGRIHFDNGLLTTQSLLAPADHLVGTGTIVTHGLLTDTDLVFDRDHPVSQLVMLDDQPDQNCLIFLDVNGTGQMGAGYTANGSLTIADGSAVVSTFGRLGYHVGAYGTAHVTGPGSVWINHQTLVVGRDGSGALTLDNRAAASSMDATIGFGEGTVGSVTVDDSSWTNQRCMQVGVRGQASLAIDAGGIVSTGSAVLASQAGSQGLANVSGLDAAWSVDDELIIANAGTGGMTVTHDGRVASGQATLANRTGSIGTVTVAGVGSIWQNTDELFVGNSGSAELSILDGGTLTSGTAVLGVAAAASGKVLVSGTDANWINDGRLSIASRGRAEMQITDGGVAASGMGFIAALPESTGSVRVEHGGQWDVAELLMVGGSLGGRGGPQIGGAGTLVIGSNGHVSAAETHLFLDGVVVIDGGMLATGELIDRGGRLQWERGTLRITGDLGLGIYPDGFFGSLLSVGPQQHLIVDHALSIENDSTLFNATGVTAGAATVAPAGQLFAGGAAQQFENGLTNFGDVVLIEATSVHGPVTNAAGGAITLLDDVTFHDPVNGPGSFYGPGMVTFAGGLSPCASPAQVSFEADVRFTSTNTLRVDIDGTTPGAEFDRLQIGGLVDLAGTLEVLAPPTLDVEIGDTLLFLHAEGGVLNAFDTVTLPALVGGKRLQLVYGETLVGLEVIAAPPLPGDFNGDGLVNAADYILWRNHEGTDFPLPNRDPNLEGNVGQADYDYWVANFGSTLASNVAVPEPATVVLIGVVALVAGIRHRQGVLARS